MNDKLSNVFIKTVNSHVEADLYDLLFAFYFQYIYEIDLRIQLKTDPLQIHHSNSWQSKSMSGI